MESTAYAEFRDLEANHWWFRGRRAIFGHLLGTYPVSAAGRRPRVLDLGCGMGGMLGMLAGHGDEFGMDISPEALSWCRGRGFQRVLLGKGDRLPFADSSLDVITAFDTIEHIPDEARALLECRRVLVPGGRLFVSVPAYQFLFTHQDRIVHHQRRYTLGRLICALRDGGFVIDQASYINFLLFPLILPVLLLIKAKEAIWRPTGSMCTNVSFPVPGFLHDLLAGIFGFERHLLRGCTLPFGHSLVAVARRPETSG
jgi:SAM-dependent methyltransferase